MLSPNMCMCCDEGIGVKMEHSAPVSGGKAGKVRVYFVASLVRALPGFLKWRLVTCAACIIHARPPAFPEIQKGSSYLPLRLLASMA